MGKNNLLAREHVDSLSFERVTLEWTVADADDGNTQVDLRDPDRDPHFTYTGYVVDWDCEEYPPQSHAQAFFESERPEPDSRLLDRDRGGIADERVPLNR